MQQNFLSLALLGALIFPALTAAAGPISLDEAIRRALRQNPELRAADRQAQAADARASRQGRASPQIVCAT